MTTMQSNPPTGAADKKTPHDSETSAAHTRGERRHEPSIFEKSSPGARAVGLPELDIEPTAIPADLAAPAPRLPELGMLQVIRHYTHLSQRNFSIDGEFYPLGSCTMKFNPRINEWAATLPGFTGAHPLQDDRDIQGTLRIMYETRRMLEEIAGLHEASLQPAAGAHGEYTALKVIRAYFRSKGETQRTKVLAPANAHGTNPASCAMCGAEAITVKAPEGYTDLDDLKRIIEQEGPDTIMAFMITNPNTAGLFDGMIGEVADIIHDAGALLYLDGANMNAILGKTRPGDFGADAMHYNTHKTFSTPHGGGGPGAGPIVVRDFLAPFLPVPQVVQQKDGAFALDYNRPHSIGKVRSFFGQFGVLLRCWTYIRACGAEGLENVSELAVLSANYLAARLQNRYEMPFFNPEKGRYAAHEFVTVPETLLNKGVTLNDIAKRLIDYGIHPPTMHWPVRNCLMVEPTETESLRTLDEFVDAMLAIADQIESDPESLAKAPQHAVVDRVDIVGADRKPTPVFEG
ncbi:MAG: glycine dehydrogenase subunit 2 [Phycisphaeraceae bacterium]|nr:MAG: glycine dehydrogenase subunit 2 [Phycisphaeraceae bacterium]